MASAWLEEQDRRKQLQAQQQQAAPPPQPSPSPTPSQQGPGAFSGGTTLTPQTSPKAAPGAGGTTTTTSDTPDPQFVKYVSAKVRSMIGSRGQYVSDADINNLVQKLWDNPQMQLIWNSYQGTPLLASQLDYWTQSVILNPNADPSLGAVTDPSIVGLYADAKASVGEALTTAELTALTTANAAAGASIPRPFNENNVSGYDWGQTLPPDLAKYTGWDVHYGVDYGTTAGERIVSPFAGTVHITHDQYYGNLVTVTLDNGWSIAFGHVAQGFADGQRVNPGDLIALAGKNVGDAKGSVTIVTVKNAKGNYVNPHELLDPIFGGTTFANLGFQGAAGLGYPSINKALDQEYPGIKSEWTQLFGTPPSPEDVLNVTSHGTSPKEWSDYMMSLPSHIGGLTVGSYTGIRGLADARSNQLFGFDSTDGIVKELNDQGFTDASGVKLWYDQHSPDEINAEFKAAAKASSKVSANVLNDPGIDPRHISQQLAKAHAKMETENG